MIVECQDVILSEGTSCCPEPPAVLGSQCQAGQEEKEGEHAANCTQDNWLISPGQIKLSDLMSSNLMHHNTVPGPGFVQFEHVLIT